MHFSRLSLSRLTGLALVLLCFAAQSQTPATSPSTPPPPPWETFATQEDRPRGAPIGSVARLLFLRPETTEGSRLPADIFVNGRLHTALLPGGFSEVDVCQGAVRLSLGGQGTSGLKRIPEQTVQAQAGQTTYILVQAPSASDPLRTATDVEQAQAQLKALQRQVHAVSRVAPALNCPAAPAPVSAPVVAVATPVAPVVPVAEPLAPTPTRYTLSAEMLFSFGGSKPQDLSEQGQTQIVRMARQIKQQLKPGQVAVVQGHTDPTGSLALNKRLSQERAETVKRILLNSGLLASQVRAEGVGSAQLLVKGCEQIAKSRDQKINCNRPNRRVEITIAPLKN